MTDDSILIGPYHFTDICELISDFIYAKGDVGKKSQFYITAIKQNNKTLIEWLISLQCPKDTSVVNFCVEHTNIPLFKWLVSEKNFPVDTETTCLVVQTGNVELVKWFYGKSNPKIWNDETVKSAVRFEEDEECGFPIVKFLVGVDKCNIEPSADASGIAANRRKFNILKYLDVSHRDHEDRKKKTFLFEQAALGGDIRILEFLLAEGYKWGGSVCAYAAGRGHLEALKWLHVKGCKWEVDFFEANACVRAALENRLECLEFAHEHGCSWCGSTLRAAAQGGSLECFIYAAEQGCDWFEDTCTKAAQCGNINILQWIFENRKDFWFPQAIVREASRNGQIIVCEWMIKEHQFQLDSSHCSSAIACGHIDLVKWIIKEKLCKIDKDKWIYCARDHKKFEILKYLQKVL